MESRERSGRVLAALVREYIASGEPVPSSHLTGAAGPGISSATVRNVLARLEDEGFVQQPHPSAGRIPTDRGYRFYVDQILESKRSAATRTPLLSCAIRMSVSGSDLTISYSFFAGRVSAPPFVTVAAHLLRNPTSRSWGKQQMGSPRSTWRPGFVPMSSSSTSGCPGSTASR